MSGSSRQPLHPDPLAGGPMSQGGKATKEQGLSGPTPQGTRTRTRVALREDDSAGTPWGTIPDEPELAELLRQHASGELDPEPVELGRLPQRTLGAGGMSKVAWTDMRRLADDMTLLMGLRLAVGKDRPLPYSTRFAAERMGWGSNHRRANRGLQRLCEAGVIFCAGSLPPRGQPYGTKTYAPPLGVGASVVEGEAVVIEASASAARSSEPEPEVGDHGGVERAVLAARLDDGLTTWDGAEGNHAPDATAATGGHNAVEALLDAFPGSELIGPPPPCPDPTRCEYRGRYASGPWTCAHNHPRSCAP